MRKIDRLIKEAKEAMIFRGHKPTNVRHSHDRNIDNSISRRYANIYCHNCIMSVQCIDKPYPNQIDIGGEAVALHCTREAKE